MTADLTLGARVTHGGVRFRVWAPSATALAVKLRDTLHPMVRGADEVFEALIPGAAAGDDYAYVFDDGRERPDPVSRWQPRGVHGPSRVVDPEAFAWRDQSWPGIALERYVIYELHVGTFTPEGTFAAAIPKLRHLRSLGITAVELMPVAEFPGARNWGYDGAHMFAPQSTYGGPDGLRALVDACHAEGLAAVLDVVYNHLGPEGNYLGEFAPYFTDRYRTPWGPAINLDGPDSDGVRRHLLSNALLWFDEYHFDALRLDAIHGIFDASPLHILEELETTVRSVPRGRPSYLIAESDLNDVRVIRPTRAGGYGIDTQWSDDFHHALRAALTGDRRGYFADFGSITQLGKAITDSFVYEGQYSAHRRRKHGTRAEGHPGQQFVIFNQNHDQIANGSQGQRLSTLVGHRAQALATTLLMTAPNLPMLFMGEEFAETAPFLYFVSHNDPALVAAVREGRRRELADLAQLDELGELADPQAEAAFVACKLDWSLLEQPPHAAMLALYRDLIALRGREACLSNCRKDLTRVWSSDRERWIVVERSATSGERALVVCNLRDAETRIACLGPAAGTYRLALASDAPRYGGDAAPASTLEISVARDGARDVPMELTLSPYAARVYLCGELR